MKSWLLSYSVPVRRLLGFAHRVLADFFFRNNGLILSGAVAYNALLSLVPLCAVIIIGFSRLFDEGHLVEALTAELKIVAPTLAPVLIDSVETFLQTREVVGWIMFLGLLFFSTFGFRVLDNAFAIIFERPSVKLKRRFWVSALLPYLFVILICIGVILITASAAAMETMAAQTQSIMGYTILWDRAMNALFYVMGVMGLAVLFMLLYHVMPVTTISFRLAFVGGVTAAVLWEIVRYILMAYFASVSVVNILYGSLGAVIVFLLSFEIAAIIVLLGAQVIAELQKNLEAGIPWYEKVPDHPNPVFGPAPEQHPHRD